MSSGNNEGKEESKLEIRDIYGRVIPVWLNTTQERKRTSIATDSSARPSGNDDQQGQRQRTEKEKNGGGVNES